MEKFLWDLLLHLTMCFFVDGLYCHLISVSHLTREKRCIFQISDRLCVIQDRITQTLIEAGEQPNGLYFFRGMDVASAVSRMASLMQQLWHSRLGHPSSKALDMLSNGVFDSKTCEVCIRAKQTRESFPLSSNKTTMPFELIHCDLWSPYRTTSICGSKYFLTILEDFTRAVWVHLLPSKQNAPKHLKDFVALVKRQFATQIKTLCSDNESEFICLREFFSEKVSFMRLHAWELRSRTVNLNGNIGISLTSPVL